MSDLSSMNTLSEVLSALEQKKIPEFRFTGTHFSDGDNRELKPADLLLVKVYRFEGVSDPSDMSIVFIFETKDKRLGYSLNAYGIYDDKGELFDNFIREVPEKDHSEQVLFVL